MTSKDAGVLDSPATRLVVKVVVYYAVLLVVGALIWRALGPNSYIGPDVSELFGSAGGVGKISKKAAQVAAEAAASGHRTAAPTVILAMLGALLLSIPVAWVYLATRAKRGYQQSVVQLLIILPIVVAGIVVLVRDSLALAFSLAGIVAAVRFRNTLDDSKDAVYVFLATGVGLASAIDLPVATAISIFFNTTVLVLWYTDFGSAPLELEGRIAQRRLKRARELAQTGTFVAQIDSEVLKNMTTEQLEGIAQRAWKRARGEEAGSKAATSGGEVRLRVRTRDPGLTKTVLEPRLDDNVKDWRLDVTKEEGEGITILDYVVQLKKKGDPQDLISVARAVSGAELVDAELR
ncbi:MAG TPA: DUF4956 domain-containing protein [Gemmatimonadaceae bacterium]